MRHSIKFKWLIIITLLISTNTQLRAIDHPGITTKVLSADRFTLIEHGKLPFAYPDHIPRQSHCYCSAKAPTWNNRNQSHSQRPDRRKNYD
nr:hypothetical protein [Bacteroides sp. UBA939]